MKYPDYFPQGWPPDDAVAEEIEAYRICKTSIIAHSDFRSFYEEGKNIRGNILGFGVSVLSNIKEANTVLKMPAHRKEYIAKGVTKANCGVIKYTPSSKHSSHYTWWLNEDATPERYFQIVKEQDNG